MAMKQDLPDIPYVLTEGERTKCAVYYLHAVRHRNEQNKRDDEKLQAALRGNNARLGVQYSDDDPEAA